MGSVVFAQEKKPFVIDEQLKTKYENYLGKKAVYETNIQGLEDSLKRLRATFHGQEDSADIKAWISHIESVIEVDKSEYQAAKTGIHAVEEGIKQEIRSAEAAGTTLVWRQSAQMPENGDYSIDTYRIVKDSIVVIPSRKPLKKINWQIDSKDSIFKSLLYPRHSSGGISLTFYTRSYANQIFCWI